MLHTVERPMSGSTFRKQTMQRLFSKEHDRFSFGVDYTASHEESRGGEGEGS